MCTAIESELKSTASDLINNDPFPQNGNVNVGVNLPLIRNLIKLSLMNVLETHSVITQVPLISSRLRAARQEVVRLL